MNHTRRVLARISLATFTVAVFLAPQIGLAQGTKGCVITDKNISEPPTPDLRATTASRVVISSEHSFELSLSPSIRAGVWPPASGRNNAYEHR